MQELQVPTRNVEVDLLTVAGTRLRGSLFVPLSAHGAGDPHDVLEALNDGRSFMPFRSADPTVGESLINKEQVLRVRLSHPDPAERAAKSHADDELDCTLVLLDGTHVHGRLGLPAPRAASRVLDKLNQAERFIPFVSAEGHELVQKRHVVRVY
jgi:hypothetical protein